MIVMKYGGTSVANAESMNRIIDIVGLHAGEKLLVVLSACAGMTDRLLKMIKSAGSGNRKLSDSLFAEICEHHTRLADEIIADNAFRDNLKEKVNSLLSALDNFREGVSLLGECTPRATDCAVSFGELLSTTIFNSAIATRGFKSAWLDARELIVTDASFGQALVNMPETEKKARKVLECFNNNDIIVTQGFIAGTPDGRTTTLGRGGSDYSAAVFGAALSAKEIQIWTDVEGILTADPRIAPKAVTIESMTFEEVREMAVFGAKVVHPDTVLPAVERNIPVRVLNTFAPLGRNTLIESAKDKRTLGISSATLKRNCALVSVKSNGSEPAQSVLSSIMATAEVLSIKVYCSSIAENNIRVIADNSEIFSEKLKGLLFPLKYSVQAVAFIGVTGELDSALSARFFAGIAEKSAGYMLTALIGASDWSIPIAVREESAETALNDIHEEILKFAKKV
jgi:aspartate kinase